MAQRQDFGSLYHCFTKTITAKESQDEASSYTAVLPDPDPSSSDSG